MCGFEARVGEHNPHLRRHAAQSRYHCVAQSDTMQGGENAP
jgi:hypothetical protein